MAKAIGVQFIVQMRPTTMHRGALTSKIENMQPYRSSVADSDVHLERRRRMPRGPHPSPSDGYELVRTLEYCSNQKVTSCDGEYEHAYGVSYDQSCDALCPSSLHPQLIPFARLKKQYLENERKGQNGNKQFSRGNHTPPATQEQNDFAETSAENRFSRGDRV